MAVGYDEAKKQFDDLFQEQAGRAPNAEDLNDFENLYHKSSDYSVDGGQGLDNPEGSFSDLLANYGEYEDTRFNRPTASNGGIGGDADPDGDGTNRGTTQTSYPRGTGPAATSSQLDGLLAALQGVNSQPDVDLSGLGVGDIPTIEVPGENLSPAIDDTLLSLMEGQDPLGVQDRLSALLARTAGGGVNSARLQTRNEQAREQLTKGETAALSDLRSVLADRGLISLPGSPEGAELDSTTRAFEPLQRTYLDELRTSQVDESQRADQAEIDGLTQAMGWTRDQLDSRLAGAQNATQRQQMLGDLALQTLNANMAWNKFIAEFGLNKEQLAETIRQGRFESVNSLINMFLALTGQSRAGFI